MKICSKCQTRYDDEEMRFCIKDGTLLTEIETAAPDRFVVSVHEPPQPAAPIAPAIAPALPNPAKPKSNAVLFAVLAALLLLAGAALGAAVYYFSQPRTELAAANQNAAINSNVGAANNNDGANSNVGASTNSNSNLNLNANVKPSPTPSPTPKLSPTPSPSNRNQNTNANQNAATTISNAAANTAANVVNSAANTAATPAAASPPPRPTTISGGIINGKATSLPRPAYPQTARQVRAAGAVNVQVTVDETGNVIAASAVSGHALLRQAAVQAARQARFHPTILSGQPVKVTGTIVYNFVLD